PPSRARRRPEPVSGPAAGRASPAAGTAAGASWSFRPRYRPAGSLVSARPALRDAGRREVVGLDELLVREVPRAPEGVEHERVPEAPELEVGQVVVGDRHAVLAEGLEVALPAPRGQAIHGLRVLAHPVVVPLGRALLRLGDPL